MDAVGDKARRGVSGVPCARRRAARPRPLTQRRLRSQICANLLAQSVGVNVIPWSGSGLTVPDITIPADVVRARRARCDGGSPR